MSNIFQTCLKGFKLKKLVVESKMTQLVELDEEPIDPQLNWSRDAKKPFLSSRTVVQPVKVEPQPVDPHLNRLMSGQEVVEVQRPPTKHSMLTASQRINRQLSSSFNSKLEVPLFQGFQTKPSSNTIGLWFQSTLLDFWLQATFTIFKRYPLLNNLSSDTPHLRIPKWYLTLNSSSQIFTNNFTKF